MKKRWKRFFEYWIDGFVRFALGAILVYLVMSFVGWEWLSFCYEGWLGEEECIWEFPRVIGIIALFCITYRAYEESK